MEVSDFEKLYLAELQELRSVEQEILEALPGMIELASHPKLKEAFQTHHKETEEQLRQLDELLEERFTYPAEHEDSSMQAILREAEKWGRMLDDPDLRDAGLIASAQRVEHYEIAVYGTLATWAKQLGFSDDLDTLLTILEEEKRTDEILTDLAKQTVNPDAAEA